MNTFDNQNTLKSELKTTSKDSFALSDKELDLVSGGNGASGGGYMPCPSRPSCPSTPSTPTESYTVPVKGEDTVHIDASIHDDNIDYPLHYRPDMPGDQ